MKTNETFAKKKKIHKHEGPTCAYARHITHANTHTHFFFLWNLIRAVLEESLHGPVPWICGFQYKCLAGREVFSLWPAALRYPSLFHNNVLYLFSLRNAATAKPGPGGEAYLNRNHIDDGKRQRKKKQQLQQQGNQPLSKGMKRNMTANKAERKIKISFRLSQHVQHLHRALWSLRVRFHVER